MANKNSTSRRRKKRHDSQENEASIPANEANKTTVSARRTAKQRQRQQQQARSFGFSSFHNRLGIMSIVLLVITALLLVCLFQRTNGDSREELSHRSTVSNGAENTNEEKLTTAATRTTTASTSVDYSMLNGDDYRVLQVLPHDTASFTQGLTYLKGGVLYESTGNYGESQLRRLNATTGDVLNVDVDVPAQYFAEGVAHFRDSHGQDCLIQLTWREQTGFIYLIDDNDDESNKDNDSNGAAMTLTLVQQFTFHSTTNQGWGITYNAATTEFIVSDGSSWLHMWDRDTLQETRRFQVTMRKRQRSEGEDTWMDVPVGHLNELEWDPTPTTSGTTSTVLANVWYTNVILRISLETGNVEHVYHFDNLYTNRSDSADCFNGIALVIGDEYECNHNDREHMSSSTPSQSSFTSQVYVTGKWWPYMYRVQLLR